MPGIKVLLVEDDWIIAKEISYTLNDLGFEVAGSFDNAEEALKFCKQQPPDLVMLDIDLSGEMTGIDLATILKKEGKIPFIFLTALANPDTIQKAKLAEPYAYLVKPASPDTLFSTIEITLHNATRRVQSLTEISAVNKDDLSYSDFIFVKNKRRLEKVLLKDILWIEAYDIYVQVKTAQHQFLLSHSLKAIEDKFPVSDFLRTHRSYLVNKHHIEAIEENCIVIIGQQIPVGKTYRDALMKKLTVF